MASRHLLYLTNENLVSLVAHGGRIATRTVFPIPGTSPEDFERHVQRLRTLPTNVITDLAEEDFRVDSIPHLGASDQAAVLGRKLTQLFRNTPYRTALPQGREADGRRDDRVVYTAITNGEVLRPWVEVLEKLQVPLEGIHSSAVFSGRLLADLRLQFAHTLLVTFTPGEAVRQTYFRNKEIKFSRLTPVALEEGETLGSLLAGEVGRTWQYLDTLRYFAPTDRLVVCVLIHPKDRPAIEPVLRDYDQIEYRLLDIEQVAGKIGLKPPPISSTAEGVLAHLFLRRPGDNHFAAPELRRFATIRHGRIAINSAAAAILAAGLGFGAWNLSQALQNRDLDLQTAQRIVALNREYDEIQRAMPAQGIAGQTMRDAVAFYAGSLRTYPTISALLLPVSGILDRYPAVRLTQVSWQAADDDKTLPPLTPTIPRTEPPIRAVTKKAESSEPAAPRGQLEADKPFSTGRHSVAIIEARVQVEGLGFREAIAQVEGLIADIGKLEGYRAGIVDSPLDITPRVGVQGKIGERDPGPSEARFSFKVTRSVEPRT